VNARIDDDHAAAAQLLKVVLDHRWPAGDDETAFARPFARH
jgi:hypothetical protein